VTAREPHLTSWRATRGRSDVELDHDALARAARCADAAWNDFRRATAHLTFAGRTTCGLAGPFWAREQLRQRLEVLDDDTMDALADDLIGEAAEVATRCQARDGARTKRSAG
jgi:hypothetical protein